MTKQIKSAFSLVLAITMLLTMAPGAFAEVNTSKLPFGNGDGRLIEATMSVRVGNDATMDADDSATYKDGAVLADGFHFAAAEILNYTVAADISGESDSVTLSTPDGSSAVTGTRTLDSTNNTIEFEWEDAKSVKRLEMWIWPVGAIKDYEIQYSDGTEWEVCSEGAFDQTQPVPALDTENYEGKRAVSYIMTFDEVTATKLRFIAKSFRSGYESAKIAEAVPRSNNNVNLIEKFSLSGKANANGWLNSTQDSDNAGHNGYASPYALNFACSAKNDNYGTNASNNGSYRHVFPAQAKKPYTNYYVCPLESAGYWYAVRLTDSPQKINKVTFKVNAGAVRSFEVWCSTAAEETLSVRKPAPSGENWKLMTTVTGNFTSGSVAEAYIPETVAAEYWMIKITDYDSGTQFYLPGLYVLADSELSELSLASAYVFDTLETDTEYDSVASEHINNLKSSFIYNGNEYNVSWESSDSSLMSVSGETANITFHEDEEEVSLIATVNASGDETLYYSVSKSFTLLPRENECIITTGDALRFETGTDSSLLTDEFVFSSYDKEISGAEDPAENPDKFARITENDLTNQEEKYIEYEWHKADKVKRLDLWVWPVGAIGEYTIETSTDGSEWVTHSSGNISGNIVNNNIENENQAVHYPILFDEVETKYLRLKINSLKEGVAEAYISEAAPKKDNNINLAQSPDGAEGIYKGYSHYMTSYIVSNTSDSDPMYRKNIASVWPVYEDGTSPKVTPDGDKLWYAAALSSDKANINRIVVPVSEGNAKEVEVLYASGEESGFDMSAEFPVAPDENANWNKAAVVRGTFNSSNPAVIDLADAPSSKFWMVRVKGASSDAVLGRVGFYILGDNDLDPISNALNGIFNNVTTDTDSDNRIKTHIGLFDTYTFNGEEYAVKWESSSALIDIETGDVSDHDRQETTVLTAIVSDMGSSAVSYCISKEYVLEGMMKVSVFDAGSNLFDADILGDNFYYSSYERTLLSEPQNAYYNLDKFMHFDEEDSGFEFYWEKPRSLKRLHIWSWPVAAIKDYEVQVSANGTEWTTHYSGTLPDQYEEEPDLRPADNGDEAGSAVFYPIVFDEPTGATQYIRFVIKSFRNNEQGAYIAEACFLETNDVNYLALKTVPGTENSNSYKTRSIYTNGFYLSDTSAGDGNAAYRRNNIAIWPVYSSSGVSPTIIKSADNPENFFYATAFQGAPVTVNKATVTVSKGEILEFEVKCAEGNSSGFKWETFPSAPDTLADYKTVARVSGKFSPGTYEVHFDNGFKSRYWMIKITQATDDAAISGLGLYELAENELNASSFVLDGIFDNVSDTAVDNVIKEKFNLPATFEKNGKTFETIWTYDSSMVNPDGTLIPAAEDRRMTLKARVGSPEEDYKHVLEKEYYLLGQDSSERTNICYDENIVITDSSAQNLNCALEHEFTFDGTKEVEIAFNESMTGGTVKLTAGNEEVLNLTRIGDEIVINKGTQDELRFDYASKIKLDISDDTYSVSMHNGVNYNIVAYNQNLLSSKDFDTIILQGSDGYILAVDSIAMKVSSNLLFDSVKEQFVFEKISPSYRAANLNGNLALIDKVGDVTFTYESADENLIRLDTQEKKGIVNLSAPGETVIKVKGVSGSTGQEFEKQFSVLIGRDNAFGEAKSVSPAASTEGKAASYAVDGNLESEFVTTAGSYRINIDLQKTQMFNKLRIIEADTSAKITGYEIWISENNVDFTKVFTGTAINSSELVAIPFSEARFVRFVVTQTSGNGTGICDICAYYDMSDKDKLDYDYNIAVKDLEIKNGTTLLKTGRFGTEFKLISNNAAVEIAETDDKKSWKVSVKGAETETVVTVTLKASNGTERAEDKEFKITVFADTNIRDNVISGNGSAGSSGGSGGGGGSASSSLATITPDTQPVEMSSYSELKNHWGANEIKTLVLKGIVQGDGKTLALDRSVTRAEFCKMIITALEIEVSPHKGSFSDVSANDWFSGFAETALEYGIMSGDASGFRGNDVISRQEMAVVLINALKSQLPELKNEGEIAFIDSASIASWASDAVKLAAGLKILNGYDTGDFKPENNLRRDEAMVVIYRVLSHLGK